MNKKLISMAIAAVLAAPAISVADVSISGTMHMSIDATDSGDASDSDNTSVSSNFSNIVFSGDEDLGNGMKAVWQVMNVTVLDESNGAQWATGPSYLGLAGDFGTVIMGKADTPYFTFQSGFDVFDGTLADLATTMGTDGGGNTNAWSDNFNLTTQNTIAYISPDMGGFSVVGAYVTDWDAAGAEDNNNTDAFSVSASYSSGGLMVGGAFERHNHDGGVTNDGIELGASMTMGETSVGLLWENLDGDSNTDRDAWAVYLTQGFGNNTAKVLYTTVNESSNNLDEASMWAIGLDHAMSKRTSVYGMYASLENDDNSQRSLGGVDHGDILTYNSGADQSGFSMGIVHSF
ncbi:hypothetical protein BOW53_11360 [Solemya pervernicosa gill symbiont]|uniref:Porin domain-containing protein n=2 Tax=Gammaproteobacteria incertae sedis TaxID=118884 RepID=A0A1T2L346_9GAMM|nr:porin [Candidatus Reidiella endopervernicosa]OOZ39501.1 hypothetical protein BOW53_11360 [Solemya pervernicosa gill symbiont]QKQ25873.1 porin [Candidatus Reidiella endopervernicosa]